MPIYVHLSSICRISYARQLSSDQLLAMLQKHYVNHLIPYSHFVRHSLSQNLSLSLFLHFRIPSEFQSKKKRILVSFILVYYFSFKSYSSMHFLCLSVRCVSVRCTYACFGFSTIPSLFSFFFFLIIIVVVVVSSFSLHLPNKSQWVVFKWVLCVCSSNTLENYMTACKQIL